MTDPTITLTGNAVAAPELRYDSEGIAQAMFTVACNHSEYDKTTGQWVDRSSEQPKIPHHAHCKRPKPVLRRSWAGSLELYCPGCGRAARGDAPAEQGQDVTE